MYNGIINVYKEKGFTSHDVVAKLRGILHQKKIGHTGTLDPDATGVLPVCLGSGTKLCDMLTDKDKTYEAVLLLGVRTDTQDISGTVLSQQSVAVTEEMAVTAIRSFEGEYMQIPPMYSALKVNGRKLCDLAREGKTVERKARPVTIYHIEVLKIELPRITMRVECSKGTYIRTLCDDIGEKLGCGGCMESLVRTKVSGFLLESSKTLAQIEELVRQDALDTIVRSVEAVFADYAQVVVPKQADKLLWNGNPLPVGCLENQSIANSADGMEYRVYSMEKTFIGVYAYQKEKQCLVPVKLFGLAQE
jgi:tRNA pseudouridine55 synthase